MHAELLIMLRSIVLEDNSNSLRYWIYTLIITTYHMNKRGFDCALSFRRFSTSLSSFFPLFFSSILPRLRTPFLFLFNLVPHQVSNHLPFAFISLTGLSSTPLHHEIQLRFIPQKLIFILLDSLACPKISIKNLLIYLFNACCMLHACTKTSIAFVGPWRIKSGGDDLFLSRNRLHLSCSSRFVLINYINQCLR